VSQKNVTIFIYFFVVTLSESSDFANIWQKLTEEICSMTVITYLSKNW